MVKTRRMMTVLNKKSLQKEKSFIPAYSKLKMVHSKSELLNYIYANVQNIQLFNSIFIME